MPEYLSPGVYVEETSFRSKSIEGVSTSTAGFVGPARWGPVSGDPELITSLADFERTYGGLDDLNLTVDGNKQQMPNYLAHGVRGFFEEGGQRLYVSRVFNFGDDGFAVDDDGIPKAHYAKLKNTENAALDVEGSPPGSSPPSGLNPMWVVARLPGEAGNMRVTFTLRVGANALTSSLKPGSTTERAFSLTQVQSFGLVHVGTPTTQNIGGRPRVMGWNSYSGSDDGLFLAYWDAQAQQWELKGNGPEITLDMLPSGTQVRSVTVL